MLAFRKPLFWLLGTLASILVQMVHSQSPQETSVPCSMVLQSQGCLNCTRAIGSGTAIICTSCGPFKFYNQTTQSCEDCFSGCAECSSRASCNQCTFGYFVTPANQSRELIGYRHTCTACMVQNCLNCTDETTCNFCSVGYTLDSVTPGTCKYRIEEWTDNAKSAMWNFFTILLIFCILTAVGVVGWFFWDRHQTRKYEEARQRVQRSREMTVIPPSIYQQGPLGVRIAKPHTSNSKVPPITSSEESASPFINPVVVPRDQLDTKNKIISLEAENIDVEVDKGQNKTFDIEDEAL